MLQDLGRDDAAGYDHVVIVGRDAFLRERVHHDDRVEWQHADGVVVLPGDLRGHGREVSGVLREVDRIDLDASEIAAIFTIRLPANCRVGVSGNSSVDDFLPRALIADVPEIPSAMPFTDEYAFLLVSSNGDVPFTKMAGSFDTVTPSSKLPMDPRIASDPSDAALRPHATLAFASALSSQISTCNGRPSEHVRFTAWTAASTPVRSRSPALPSGDVDAAIDVNLIGAPGHGFDGAVVRGVDELAPLELLPLHAVAERTRTTIRSTRRARGPRTPVHDCLPEGSFAPFS